jgi:hypothetical protein
MPAPPAYRVGAWSQSGGRMPPPSVDHGRRHSSRYGWLGAAMARSSRPLIGSTGIRLLVMATWV